MDSRQRRFGFDGIYSEDRTSDTLIRTDQDLNQSKLSNAVDKTVELLNLAKNDQSIGVFPPQVYRQKSNIFCQTFVIKLESSQLILDCVENFQMT